MSSQYSEVKLDILVSLPVLFLVLTLMAGTLGIPCVVIFRKLSFLIVLVFKICFTHRLTSLFLNVPCKQIDENQE